MHVVGIADPIEFAGRTRDFLLQDEARYNLPLGITSTLVNRPELHPTFHLWLVLDGEELVEVAMMTPPFKVVVTQPTLAGALEVLAEAIHDRAIHIPGVVGAVPEADDFARAWSARTGVEVVLEMDTRIFRLTHVTPPRPVPGRMRDARQDDRDLLVAWLDAFTEEALVGDEGIPSSRIVDARLEGGKGSGLVMWETDRPVSLVGFGGATPNGARIGPVYTPPEHRRHGYASALTAALSQRLLDEGNRFCFLYTDLANPTSNRIYQEIGYEPVCDSKQYGFRQPVAASRSESAGP